MAQQVAFTKSTVAVLGKGRMIRDAVTQGEAAKTTDVLGSNAPLRTSGVRIGCQSNGAQATSGSSIPDQWMGGQCGCKTRQDAHEYHSSQQTDQSNATGGFGERDLPAKTHKTVLPAPPAMVATSPPRFPTKIESATAPQINKSFSTQSAQSVKWIFTLRALAAQKLRQASKFPQYCAAE